MCEPILVTLLKMRPHYSQSRHKIATPSRGTSSLAFYKEALLPPGGGQDLLPWAGLFKSWVSAKFEFRNESLKSKFSLILFVNVDDWMLLTITEKIILNSFEQEKKKLGLNLTLRR